MYNSRDEERLRRNDESRRNATHHTMPWCSDELEVLLMWDKSEPELIAIAELLGRTIEACRQRWYEEQSHRVRHVTHTTTQTTTTTTVHWVDDDDWPDWYVRG